MRELPPKKYMVIEQKWPNLRSYLLIMQHWTTGPSWARSSMGLSFQPNKWLVPGMVRKGGVVVRIRAV